MNWDTSAEDDKKIALIIDKVMPTLNPTGSPVGHQRIDVQMSLSAAHLNGCPLDLDKLVEFPLADMIHDVSGIHNNISFVDGSLSRGFLPKCTLKNQEYIVAWEMSFEAKSPQKAARMAREVQLDSDNIANHFVVVDGKGNLTNVNVLELDNEK